ncbi:MAG: hypothetical protein NTX12_06715 [Actinobacteria bacterium]|nr:hypothetical protein [Actinomycetota bacterium]
MAMPLLAPVDSRSRKVDSRTSTRAVLQLVPNFANGETADRRVFAVFLSLVGAVGLLLLLAINTLLAQDAFELHKMQAQVMTLSDQRDAVMKQIARASSPEVLAAEAIKAGMVESQSPRFLSIAPPPTSEKSVIKNG